MEWLKEFIKGLPLEKISEIVANVVLWWSDQVKQIPASELPFKVYVGGSLIACIVWYFIARVLPRPLGGMTLIIMIAVLFTPDSSLGDNAEIAPACIAVIYAILMNDYHSAAVHALPIVAVIFAGFFLGFVWQCIKYVIYQNQGKKSTKPKKKSKLKFKNKPQKKNNVKKSKKTEIKQILKDKFNKIRSKLSVKK